MSSLHHPQTGIHYAQTVHGGTFGPHMDIFFSMQKQAGIRPWMSLHNLENLREDPQGGPSAGWAHWIYTDPRVLVVVWGGVPLMPRRDQRKAKVALVYSEAIGPITSMLPDHIKDMERLRTSIDEGRIDAVFAHTPWMAEQLGGLGVPAFVLPVGWDPDVYGRPDFVRKKDRMYMFYGSYAGKRCQIIPEVFAQLGDRIEGLNGRFGPDIPRELQRAQANLYIAHSDVQSFSTWRTWQTLASSAALVAEPADCWPLEREHFVQIPRISSKNLSQVVCDLIDIPQNVDLAAIAQKAHNEIAQKFTVDYCVDEYMVPAAKSLWES